MNVTARADRMRRSAGAGPLDRLARSAVLRQFGALEHGELIVEEQGEVHRFGRVTPLCGLRARVRVRRPAAYRAFAFGGSAGAGAAYIRADWDADDLTALIRILAVNLAAVNRSQGWRARLRTPLVAALRAWPASRERARSAVGAHYDLGNALYALFLDASMTYSAGVFERPDMTLEQAQQAKIERLCHKLDLRPGQHLLEIGTGWGALAEHAARHHGCRVTTTTISREQARYARERIAAAGLSGQVEVLELDYRDLDGRYDRVVSVEMIEAVGHRLHADFFRRVGTLLKPDGLLALQAITIAEQRHDAAARGEDFIQRYVFPGGSLPSVARMTTLVARETNLQTVHLEDFGPHYATTLAHWRQRFEASLDQVRAQGYPRRFERLWRFYLAYCEGAFAERAIGVVQMLCAGPLARREPIMPALAR